LHLARIDGDAILGENVTTKGYFLKPKFALAKLGIKTMLSKFLQHNMDVVSMIIPSLRIDKNVINKDNHKDIKLLHEDTIHQVHEIRRCIGEAKGHDGVLIETISSRESRFWNIFLTNLNLMITQS
jgi:hypothetical protein